MEELQNQAPKIDSANAIRCAKVVCLLSDLRHSSTDEDEFAKKEVAAELKRELMKIERQLLKERENNKRRRFDSALELCIWIVIFFFLWNICIFLFFDFPHHY